MENKCRYEGIPLVVVIIVLAIDVKIYGLVSWQFGSPDSFCWINVKAALFAAVMAYFCVTYLLTLIMFIVVMVLMCRIKRNTPKYARKQSLMRNARSVTALIVLLGLTWGFAFFAWGPIQEAFNYLFTICNSLQGFSIFMFYCVAKREVKKKWRMYMRCRAWVIPARTDIFRGMPAIFSKFRQSFSPSKAKTNDSEGPIHFISLEGKYAATSTTLESTLSNETAVTDDDGDKGVIYMATQ